MSNRPHTLSQIALSAGLLGLAGIGICSAPLLLSLGAALTFLGPLAVVLGIASRFQPADSLAIWAIVIGVFVSMHIPTVLVPFIAD